jgi:hypothetical protein
LVRNVGELAARRCQVRRGHPQITLHLRHPRFKHRLLAAAALAVARAVVSVAAAEVLALSAASSADAAAA